MLKKNRLTIKQKKIKKCDELEMKDKFCIKDVQNFYKDD